MVVAKFLWRKVTITSFLATICIYFFTINYTEPTELGIARNVISGKMWIQDRGGWHRTSPFVFVSVLDLRPMRVSIPSSGHGYRAILVQFDKNYWQKFVATEGFRYYWWGNRFSFNSGYHEEYRGQRDIMRGYAFGTKKYPFIKIITEYQ